MDGWCVGGWVGGWWVGEGVGGGWMAAACILKFIQLSIDSNCEKTIINPTLTPTPNPQPFNPSTPPPLDLPFEEKLSFFKKERRSLGRTALCLSGGGAITMYHMGVVKAFIEAELYQVSAMCSGVCGVSCVVCGADGVTPPPFPPSLPSSLFSPPVN